MRLMTTIVSSERDGGDVVELHLLHPLHRHVEERQNVSPSARQIDEQRRVELDAERPVGQIGHLVDEDLDDGAEGERHHGEIGTGDAQRRQGQKGAEQAAATTTPSGSAGQKPRPKCIDSTPAV